MLIQHNPDDFVVVTTQHTCEYHKRKPWDVAYAGCGCGGSIGQRRATPEERAANIAAREAEEERRRKHIDDYDAAQRKQP